MGAQVFHRDRDEFRACKLFVYLTDVGPEDGPHVFVRGSHDPANLAADLGLPQSQVASFFEKDGRAMAATIETRLPRQVTELTGAAGTSFLEITYGFHRGKPPTAARRVLLQALFALVPYPNRVQHCARKRLAELPSDCEDSPLNRHMLRLFL